MSVVGDKAELEIARKLSTLGFELIYQSRASRGAFARLGAAVTLTERGALDNVLAWLEST